MPRALRWSYGVGQFLNPEAQAPAFQPVRPGSGLSIVCTTNRQPLARMLHSWVRIVDFGMRGTATNLFHLVVDQAWVSLLCLVQGLGFGVCDSGSCFLGEGLTFKVQG